MCALAILSLELLNIDTWVNSKQVFSMTDDSETLFLWEIYTSSTALTHSGCSPQPH